MRKILAASVAISMGMGVAGASKAADIVIGTPKLAFGPDYREKSSK